MCKLFFPGEVVLADIIETGVISGGKRASSQKSAILKWRPVKKREIWTHKQREEKQLKCGLAAKCAEENRVISWPAPTISIEVTLRMCLQPVFSLSSALQPIFDLSSACLQPTPAYLHPKSLGRKSTCSSEVTAVTWWRTSCAVMCIFSI